jgi:preprotein translocase YajC subunit
VNHSLALAPALVLAATKSSAKTTSSGSFTFIIFIVIVVAALYFLFLRPNQQKAKRQREEHASIGVGDRVVTIGGIVGTIEEMEGDRVVLTSGDAGFDGSGGPPTRLVLLRSAIARKVDLGTSVSSAEQPSTGAHSEDPAPGDDEEPGGSKE